MNEPSNPTPEELKIDEQLVIKIQSLLSHGLTKGLGQQEPGKMCVEAAICFAMGLPHSDNPPCVGQVFKRAKIRLNDCNWSSNKARAEGMKYLAIAQLGSNNLDQKEANLKLKLNSTKRILTYLIQKHFEKTKDEKLLEYKRKFEDLNQLDYGLWQEFYYNNYYYYDYYYFGGESFGDNFLLLVADVILQTLKEMDCEGCKYLHLVK